VRHLFTAGNQLSVGFPKQPRDERLWSSDFARFVTAYGVTRLARGLEIRTSAIYHWISGATSPTRARAAIIQELAREFGTTLTLEQIYQHTQHARDLRGPAGRRSPSDEVRDRDEVRDNDSIRLLMAEIYYLFARLLAPAGRTPTNRPPVDDSRHTSAAQASAK
jgi:hypothetical protein